MFMLKSLMLAVICMLSSVAIAHAQSTSFSIATPATEALIMEYDTGTVVYAKNADAPMKPASMAKMMTIYLLFERLKSGALSLDDKFPISEKAYRLGGSRSFLELGDYVRVEDLMRGVIVQSGNDAAVAIAEGLAGSEEEFARQMTETAIKLGMTNTIFGNSTGWPDAVTTSTVRDIAILAHATIKDFPELYRIYDEVSFTYNNIKQGNRNPLLYTMEEADGLKTGYTEESGFALAASAKRGNTRFILVLSGLETNQQRRRESIRLMNLTLTTFKKYRLLGEDEVVDEVPVILGKKTWVDVVASDEVERVLSFNEFNALKKVINLPNELNAPIARGEKLGEVIFTIGNRVERFPLVAREEVKRLPFFLRMIAFAKYLVFGREVRRGEAQ